MSDIHTEKLAENKSPNNNNTFDLAQGIEFTFRASIGSMGESNIATGVRDLKRLKGHPDGPTPANSPQKKRTRAVASNADDLPSPLLLFTVPLASAGLPSINQDIFGTKTAATKSSDAADPEPGTLFSFWKWESAENTVERNHRDFEELTRTREKRELEEERMKAMREDRRRVDDRERQQRHRDKVQERRVANGWKPNQKRVSLLFLL